MSTSLRVWFMRPVAGQSLAFVRITFCGIMFYEALWYLGLTSGFGASVAPIEQFFTGDHVRWHIPFPGFEFLARVPAQWTHAIVGLMAIAALFGAAGWFYRPAMACVALCFTYVTFREAANYLNHFYLSCLIAFLLACMPADRCWRLPVYRLREARRDANRLHPTHVPFWCLFLLRFQMVVVYFFAGIAKLNADWLAGEPLRTWLAHPETASKMTLLGAWEPSLRQMLRSELTVWLCIYGGLFLDLLAAPLLLWRRTRLATAAMLVLFHLSNFTLFEIGAFPLMAVCLTTIFFSPDWPNRLYRRILVPRIPPNDTVSESVKAAWSTPHPRLVMLLVACWMTVQIAMPLRHLLIPGNVNWTEEGHRFSWRMKLRTKAAGPFLIEVEPPETDRDIDAIADRNTRGPSKLREVDPITLDWSRLPPIVTTFEPVLGHRIWLNPDSPDDWRSAVVAWQQKLGEVPSVQATRSIRAALADLIALAERRDRPDLCSQLETAAQQWAASTMEGLQPARGDLASLQFQQTLYRIVAREPQWRESILKRLLLTPPFAIQGYERQVSSVQVLMSKTVQLTDTDVALTIDRASWSGDVPFIEPNRMTPRSWSALPAIVALEGTDGSQRFIWNYTQHLHPMQWHALQTSPIVIQQYARHVANRWHDLSGNWPKVFVQSSTKLNHRPVQRMIDPQTDLAGEQWSWTRHRQWIVPLEKNVSNPQLIGRRLDSSASENR